MLIVIYINLNLHFMVHKYKIFDMKIVMNFLFLKTMFGGYTLSLFTTISVTTKAQTDPNRQQNISDWVSQM